MDFPLRRLLPFVVIFVLMIYEWRVFIPSCEVVMNDDYVAEGESVNGAKQSEEDLKVMMVANLLLLGSKASFFDTLFRDYHLSRFFLKSFETLKPDMLIVLGDVSARGAELGKSNWSDVIRQLYRVLGPFLGLPFHIVLGDRDIGVCSGLNAVSVDWIANSFPGLDSAGCGAFKINNISFVSLNSVALLCGNNNLRFSVEGVVERESIEYRKESEHSTRSPNDSTKIRTPLSDFEWEENSKSSGSGPVILLHIPLFHSSNRYLGCDTYLADSKCSHKSFEAKKRVLAGSGPYELWQTLPINATEYIFQALKPRMVFSSHTHDFHDRIHPDGTREITVPAMSWYAKDNPGFIVAAFRNYREVTISRCAVASESRVLTAYISIMVALVLALVFANIPYSNNSRN